MPAQGFRAVGESAGGGQRGVAVAFAELFNRGTFRRRLPIRAVVTTYFTGFEVVLVHDLSLWLLLLDGFVSGSFILGAFRQLMKGSGLAFHRQLWDKSTGRSA